MGFYDGTAVLEKNVLIKILRKNHNLSGALPRRKTVRQVMNSAGPSEFICPARLPVKQWILYADLELWNKELPFHKWHFLITGTASRFRFRSDSSSASAAAAEVGD